LNFLFLAILASTGLCAIQVARAEEADRQAISAKPVKTPVESEIIVEGMASYGNWKIFAGGTNCKLYTGGVEYDRNSWGRVLGARLDYSAEVLPLVILSEPTKMDIWGSTLSPNRQLVGGLSISPIGARLMWFDKKRFKPYLGIKGGLIAFPIKVLSTEASYVNLSLQSSVGLQAQLTRKLDLRLGIFNDFHFSDGFVVPVNPGLDVMNSNLGLVYHLGRRK
jgi:hypothetical protein